jgi:transposase InsO family protein
MGQQLMPYTKPSYLEVLRGYQDFTADAPDKKWMSDFTYLETREGWLYRGTGLLMPIHAKSLVGL